uniref:Uncharacterized protein n=1 Tax=Arundo donax TaxID=35708 RepID=A0A0A9EGR7_ARUDO
MIELLMYELLLELIYSDQSHQIKQYPSAEEVSSFEESEEMTAHRFSFLVLLPCYPNF